MTNRKKMKIIRIFLAILFISLCHSCSNQGSKTKVSSSVDSLSEDISLEKVTPADSLKVFGDGQYETPRGDTILSTNPYIKNFVGLVDGKNAQIYLEYSSSLESYVYSFYGSMQLEGRREKFYFHLELGDAGNWQDWAYQHIDEFQEHYFEYTADSILIVKSRESVDTMRLADVQYRMYSQFQYEMISCQREDYISYAEHWSYQSLTCPDTYPAEYAAFFESNPLAQMDSIYVTKSYLNWKDSIALKITPEEEREDDIGCYTTYTQESTTPYSLDTTVFVVITSGDLYLGGAHGLPSVSYTNFDVQTGKIILLNDILTIDDSFLEFYFERLDQDCKKEYGNYLSEPSLTENICIQPTGLLFLYQPYELMGFAAGMPELFLSFDDLRPYLNINPLTERLLNRYNLYNI